MSIVETKITDITGCFAISQRNKATKESKKNTVSEFVMSFLPLLIPRKNTKKAKTATVSVIQELTPAPALTWRPNAIAVTNPQINHVYT
ncbi:MAG: hypothetical protein UT84_C0001G0075 [Candidatus Curtissbacteria bacterium GW2011_GWA1_40_16]|uniref:Uncharacterized protein n=1 Tax=Candidatus Curtissbacteria bacterium GW2011_GWA1_40_16 TaxID=1618405 RepID=A0A0G0TWB7_9BACT|nr:MAG: hypothetical protein UT84_C0001G0075 [Candidatus Curtissbacteria bacterium GW2011_GWA1_40_16]